MLPPPPQMMAMDGEFGVAGGGTGASEDLVMLRRMPDGSYQMIQTWQQPQSPSNPSRQASVANSGMSSPSAPKFSVYGGMEGGT